MTVPTLDNSPTAAAAAASGFQAGMQDSQTGGFVQVTPPTTSLSRVFSAEEIEAARRQEKDKLYPQIEDLRARLAVFENEKKTREEEERKARESAAEEARKKADSETDVRTLLSQRETEWQQRLEEERQAREQAFALLERERELASVESYRQQAVMGNQADILPELLDLVSGNSREEIDASIAGLKDRSARILEAAQAAAQSTRQNMAGSRVTSPAAGPLDTQSEHRQYTPDEIRGMSMKDYSQIRGKLLGNRSPNNRGIFG